MISIHIVSFKKSRHAINAVQSVLNQKIGFGKYEVLVLECSEDYDNEKLFWEFHDTLLTSEKQSVTYYSGQGNFGLAKGLNYLHSVQNPETKYILEMNEDMFFAPFAIENMVEVLESDPNLGLACANLTTGGLYNRLEPSKEDVDDYGKRYTDREPLKINYEGSNLPFAITEDFYWKLSKFDVWNGSALPFNEFTGIWDESIDPYGVGWYSDWDIYQRVRVLGKKTAIIENAHCYHADHCSGSELDVAKPSWTTIAQSNYRVKYGSEEKITEITKKDLPLGYPLQKAS